jgi:SSS family solute:Na+ symporter
MKIGALGFALALNKTFSINLQLLGGIWIVQTFPAVVIGLYTRWFHRYALIAGWAVGMVYGTIQAYRTSGGGQSHFGGSAAPVFGHVTYIALTALILNVVVSTLLTPVLRAAGVQDGYDETRPSDYLADPDPASIPRPRPADLAANVPADLAANVPAGHAARHRAAPTAVGSPRSAPQSGPSH